jgi:hypothetical protein
MEMLNESTEWWVTYGNDKDFENSEENFLDR